MAWVLTAGLNNLRSQVNARWPNRDKKSDGTIGDAAHQAESSSDHNPDDTAGSRPGWDGDSDSLQEVRAWDMDSDLGESGTTAQMVVDHLRKLPNLSSVIRYMIYNRKLYHSRDNFEPTTYTGSSAHTEHIHFSGAWTNAGDSNTTFDFQLRKVGNIVATLDKEDITAIAKAIWAFDPGKDKDGNIWPGVSDATYPPGGNGTVAPGTAMSSLLARQDSQYRALLAAIGARVPADVDESALAASLAAVLAPMLTGVTEEQIADAVRTVLREGVGTA